jgi:F-type H+-transporting ATPase subunit a
MKRTAFAAALTGFMFSSVAFAAAGGSTADVILHHVSDSDEYEFEVPWPGIEKNPTLYFTNEVFDFLVFEKTPGACDMEVPTGSALSAFPGIAKWMGGCYDMRPTKNLMLMWIAAALLLLFAAWPRRYRDASKLMPTGLRTNILEAVVLFIRDEIAEKNIGNPEAKRYTPFLCTAFMFILFMNWLGLVPTFGSATGSLAVTCGLAITTFVLTQIASFRSAGAIGFAKHLTGGVPWFLTPIMVPIEIIGLFTKPFALMIRLFANLLAGHMVLFFIIGLIFLVSAWAVFAAVPMAAAIYFLEIFIGFVQAYVFTILSAVFIGQGVAMGHHAEH